MNSKDFLIALRTLIREEVRAAVRDEIQSLNENVKSSTNRLSTKDIYENLNTKPSVSKPVAKKKSFTKDPLLNELLNDTARRPTQLTENYDTFGMFSAEMAQGFGTMRSTEPAVAPSRDLDGRPVNMNNENVATVVNAMTKDYSALMKAIDKKKGKA